MTTTIVAENTRELHDLPDEILARRAADGRPDYFEVILTRYRDRVYRICYRMAGNSEDAEDWAQECFVRAYRELRRYNPVMPFRPWLFRVVCNACINLSKTRSRRRDRLDLGIDHLSIPASDASDPVRSTFAAEDTRAIRIALETLPLKMRQAVVLRLLEGLSFRELGEILGVPTQTAATRVRRALIRVREQLQRNGVEVVI